MSSVALLESRGRFLVAEPLFGPATRGRPPVVDTGNMKGRRPRAGDIVLLGAGRTARRGGLGRPRVLRVIGRADVARDVIEALMLDRGLRRTFPAEVEREAHAAAESHDVAAARRDLRDLPTFTIDPSDARDFDDAISAQRLDDGTLRVWVHIADVSAHVPVGSPVDREARRRATSVYVPGAVEPMLPQALSNAAC